MQVRHSPSCVPPFSLSLGIETQLLLLAVTLNKKRVLVPMRTEIEEQMCLFHMLGPRSYVGGNCQIYARCTDTWLPDTGLECQAGLPNSEAFKACPMQTQSCEISRTFEKERSRDSFNKHSLQAAIAEVDGNPAIQRTRKEVA
jgi:hypothetical protein